MMLEWKNKRRKVITLSAFEGQDEDRSARADSAQEGADSAGTAGGGSGDSCALSKAEAVALAETGLFAEGAQLSYESTHLTCASCSASLVSPGRPDRLAGARDEGAVPPCAEPPLRRSARR